MAVGSVIAQGRVFPVVRSLIRNNSSDPAVSSLVANLQSASGSVNVRPERIPALPALKSPGLVKSAVAKFQEIGSTPAPQEYLSHIREECHLFADRSIKILKEAGNCKNSEEIESKKKEIFNNLSKFNELIYSYRDGERACMQQYRLKSFEMTAEKLAQNMITKMDGMKNKL